MDSTRNGSFGMNKKFVLTWFCSKWCQASSIFSWTWIISGP